MGASDTQRFAVGTPEATAIGTGGAPTDWAEMVLHVSHRKSWLREKYRFSSSVEPPTEERFGWGFRLLEHFAVEGLRGLQGLHWPTSLNLASNYVLYVAQPTGERWGDSQSGLAQAYEAQLSRLEKQHDQTALEEQLVEANENRELMDSLMRSDWLGLELLAELNSNGPLGVKDLSAELKTNLDSIAVVLAELTRTGAVSVVGDRFVSTESGSQILDSLQQSTGIKLTTK
jgi:hypothetical protein